MLLVAANAAFAKPAPPTLAGLLARPGPDVALLFGTSDYAPGTIRVSFLVVRNDGKPVNRPRARVWLGVGPEARPFAEAVARLEATTPHGATAADDEVSSIYVVKLRVPRAGTYRIVAEPVGGEPIQGFQNLVVSARTAAPAVGAKAIPSRTPTLADARGDASKLTTRVPPDRALLRYSVRDSLRARRPFVLVFATPKWCSSRTCGPVVDVVDAVRRRYERSGIRFIHVEIYKDNKPSLGPNAWAREWHLPSEPFVFLVGRDGRIKARFEGSLSEAELAAAVEQTLVRRRS